MASTVRLGIHRDFLPRYARLDKQVRNRVDDVFREFDSATHTGLHLEKIQGARDPRMRTIRITDFWRGVVLAPQSGDTYLLLRVLPLTARVTSRRGWRSSRTRPMGPIPLTTFTRTLAEDLRRNLELLLDEQQLRKVEVCHVDRLANRIVSESLGRPPALMNAPEEKARWRDVIARLELPFTEDFLANEWQHVIQAQDLRSRKAYLSASRAGGRHEAR